MEAKGSTIEQFYPKNIANMVIISASLLLEFASFALATCLIIPSIPPTYEIGFGMEMKAGGGE